MFSTSLLLLLCVCVQYVNLLFHNNILVQALLVDGPLWDYSATIILPDSLHNNIHYSLTFWVLMCLSLISLFSVSNLEVKLHEGSGMECCALQ